MTLQGFWAAAYNTIHHSSRNAPGWRSRAESGQGDRGLWPEGNTAPKTTLLSGYGWTPSEGLITFAEPGARAAPVSLKGADPQGKGAASDWGTSPTLLLAWAWPGTPSPIQSYTRRGSMRSQSAWITALDLVSSRTRPGGLFLDSFLTHFGGVFGRFLAAPKSRTIPRPAGLTYCKIGSSPSRREGAPLDFFQAIDFFMRF